MTRNKIVRLYVANGNLGSWQNSTELSDHSVRSFRWGVAYHLGLGFRRWLTGGPKLAITKQLLLLTRFIDEYVFKRWLVFYSRVVDSRYSVFKFIDDWMQSNACCTVCLAQCELSHKWGYRHEEMLIKEQQSDYYFHQPWRYGAPPRQHPQRQREDGQMAWVMVTQSLFVVWGVIWNLCAFCMFLLWFSRLVWDWFYSEVEKQFSVTTTTVMETTTSTGSERSE